MDIIHINKRRSGFVRGLLTALLVSCSSSPTWQVSHLQASRKEFISSRLSYPLYDKVHGIAVEMIYSQNSIRTYLEVHSQTIPPYQGNREEALVKAHTPEQTLQAIGHRHQGGQRVSLPLDLQQFIVESLDKGRPVTLELTGFSTTLDPHHFSSSYRELQKNPLRSPLQLPFKL